MHYFHVIARSSAITSKRRHAPCYLEMFDVEKLQAYFHVALLRIFVLSSSELNADTDRKFANTVVLSLRASRIFYYRVVLSPITSAIWKHLCG